MRRSSLLKRIPVLRREESRMTEARVAPPEAFNFRRPEEWTRWKRRFERYRSVSGLNTKDDAAQINTLIYCMGDDAEDILASFSLSEEDAKKYGTVEKKFDDHFNPRKNVIFERAKLTPGNKRMESLWKHSSRNFTSYLNIASTEI